MNIGERIKIIRKENKLTQEEFSDKLGVNTSYISRLENNNSSPSSSLIKVICTFFHINEEWLTTGEGKKNLTVDVFTTDEAKNLDESYLRRNIFKYLSYSSTLSETIAIDDIIEDFLRIMNTGIVPDEFIGQYYQDISKMFYNFLKISSVIKHSYANIKEDSEDKEIVNISIKSYLNIMQKDLCK